MMIKRKNIKDDQHYFWRFRGQIGQTLNEYLKERPCKDYCPDETAKVIMKIVDEVYNMGFDDAVSEIYGIMFNLQHGIEKRSVKACIENVELSDKDMEISF